MRRFGGMASSAFLCKCNGKLIKGLLSHGCWSSQVDMEEKNQRSNHAPLRIKGSLQTLKLNKEFKRAYYQGKSKATPYFICYRVKNRGAGLRYGLTTSKKVGNAVCRNKARRLLRAALRAVEPRLGENWDYVFVARERILSAKSYQVAAMMKGCLKDLEKMGEKPKRETAKG